MGEVFIRWVGPGPIEPGGAGGGVEVSNKCK